MNHIDKSIEMLCEDIAISKLKIIESKWWQFRLRSLERLNIRSYRKLINHQIGKL